MRPSVALVLGLLALTLLAGVKGRRRNKGLRMRDGGKKDKCRYNRDGEWSQCGPGVATRQRTMVLEPGSPEHCQPTRTVTKPCRKGRKGRRLDSSRRNNKPRGCKYGRKSAWSKCGAGVEERSREQRLLSGPSDCPRVHVISKPCRKKNRRQKNKKNGRGKNGCQYEKRPWQPCNKESKVKKRELLLKKGDPSVCSALRTIEKPCRRRATLTGPQISKCRYKALPWSECNSRTNTQSRSLQLKSGDPALCQHSKTLTRKCRKPCKFSKGEWSECDAVTGLKSRTDRLVKGDPALCEATRVISKMCNKDGKCKYEVGNWSDCDQESGMRTRVKTRTEGDTEKCQQQINVQRPCVKPNGEEGCFLGNWGEYGQCQNGVMTKHRPVIAGGMECERKAVKVKPCP